MVQAKKKFKKIVLGDDVDSWKRQLIGKNIHDTLNSGELFTLDNQILPNSSSNLNYEENDSNNTVKKVHTKKSFSNNCVKNSTNLCLLKKNRSFNDDELDIWKDSISNLDISNTHVNYPGELLKSKGPSIQLPHSGQSINPLESDRQDALFKSFSVSNASIFNKNKNIFPTSLINSFISNYYESDEILNLTESQKYYLTNSILNGKILKLDSIGNIELIKDAQNEKDIILYSSRQSNGIRKKKSEINREIRKKKELIFNEEKAKIKKLNKDIQNIGKFLR